jgi:hypothetical protein
MSYSSTRALALGVDPAELIDAAQLIPGLPTFAWEPPNVPFNPANYDPKTFAQTQFATWSSAAMQTGIDKGREQYAAALKVVLPKLPSMGQSELGDWTTGYVQEHGVPTDWESAARMGTALAHAQAAKLGVPPEWIAAADVVMHPPADGPAAVLMVANIGKAYFEKYGVPLLQHELLNVSANLSLVANAIPVQFAIAGFDALKDGKLSKEEIAGIAVQAACYACAALLQAFGIPAPLGAIMASVVAQGLTAVAQSVIYNDDADMRARKAAYAALDEQRRALMTECASAAQKTWNKTQEYWDQILAPIQGLLDQPVVAARLQATKGLRYFGRNVVTLPYGVLLPQTETAVANQYRAPGDWVAMAAQAEAAAVAAEKAFAACDSRTCSGAHINALQARRRANDIARKAAAQAKLPPYRYGFDCLWWEGNTDFYSDNRSGINRTIMPANARPFPNGCLYYGRIEPSGVWSGKSQRLDVNQWEQKPYWVDPTNVWDRCGSRNSGYSSFWSPDSEGGCAGALKLASQFKYSFDGGYETQTMQVRLIPYSAHSVGVSSKTVAITRGALVDGRPNAQAALQFWGAKRPTMPFPNAAGRSDAEQWKLFANIDQSAMEVYKIDGTLTAKLNLPFNYCDVDQWAAAVQIASAASALVQQDILRTSAWQAGIEEAGRQIAKLQAKQAQDAAALIALAKALQAKNEKDRLALIAYARWKQQQATAEMVARAATQARLQAKAIGTARAASGAYASALKFRLRYQTAQAAKVTQQAMQKTTLWVGGLAVGAFVIWKIATNRK